MVKFGFHNEFEYESNDGSMFYVEITGERFSYEGRMFTDINHLMITDELGNEIDDTHDFYSEIEEEATYRDYEIHSGDFDYSDDYVNSFLKEVV